MLATTFMPSETGEQRRPKWNGWVLRVLSWATNAPFTRRLAWVAQQMECVRVVVSAIYVPSLSVPSFSGFTNCVSRQLYLPLGPLMSDLRTPISNSHTVVVRTREVGHMSRTFARPKQKRCYNCQSSIRV